MTSRAVPKVDSIVKPVPLRLRRRYVRRPRRRPLRPTSAVSAAVAAFDQPTTPLPAHPHVHTHAPPTISPLPTPLPTPNPSATSVTVAWSCRARAVEHVPHVRGDRRPARECGRAAGQPISIAAGKKITLRPQRKEAQDLAQRQRDGHVPAVHRRDGWRALDRVRHDRGFGATAIIAEAGADVQLADVSIASSSTIRGRAGGAAARAASSPTSAAARSGSSTARAPTSRAATCAPTRRGTAARCACSTSRPSGSTSARCSRRTSRRTRAARSTRPTASSRCAARSSRTTARSTTAAASRSKAGERDALRRAPRQQLGRPRRRGASVASGATLIVGGVNVSANRAEGSGGGIGAREGASVAVLPSLAADPTQSVKTSISACAAVVEPTSTNFSFNEAALHGGGVGVDAATLAIVGQVGFNGNRALTGAAAGSARWRRRQRSPSHRAAANSAKMRRTVRVAAVDAHAELTVSVRTTPRRCRAAASTSAARAPRVRRSRRAQQQRGRRGAASRWRTAGLRFRSGPRGQQRAHERWHRRGELPPAPRRTT